MDVSLGDFSTQIIALLVGGLGTSLGLTFGTRSSRGQAFLVSLSGGILGLACLILTAVGGGVAYIIVASVIERGAAEPATLPASQLLVLGIAVGLPLGLPGVFAAWSDARRRDRIAKKKRDYVPTKDDRRAYAVQLVDQITEVSPTPRTLTASIAGDGGTILRFEGDVDAKEGERLTNALRGDLADVGFKRLEGKKGSREWWSRV